MIRGDARSVATVLGAAGSNALAAAVLGVITARTLGPEGQGELTAVTTTAAVVVVGAVLGTGASLRLRGEPFPADSDVRAFTGLSLLLAPLGGAASSAVVALIRSTTTTELLLVFILGLFAVLAYQACQVVQAYGSVSRSLAAAGLGVAAQVVAFSISAFLGHASVVSALSAAILGSAAQCAFAVASVHSHIAAMRPSWTSLTWGQLIRHGSPTVGYGLGLIGMQRMDRLVLVAVAGATAGGIYAVAASLAEVVRISSGAIGQLLFVRAASSRGAPDSVSRIYALAVVIQVAGIAALGALAPVLVPPIFGNAYSDAIPLVRGLLVGEFFLGLALMDARILLGRGQFVTVSLLTVTMFVVSLPVYLLAIRAWASWGAVVGSIALYAAYSIALLAIRFSDHRRARDSPENPLLGAAR